MVLCKHSVLLARNRWMRFVQRTTYTTPSHLPSQTTFGDRSLATPYTDSLSTLIHGNRPAADTFHLDFAGVHAISLSSTLSLAPVHLVRSSDIPALTGHYLVDMLPRDGLPSETEIFVTNDYQNIPLSGFTDLEPGDLLETSFFPFIQTPISVLQDLHTESPPTPAGNDVHALYLVRQHPRGRRRTPSCRLPQDSLPQTLGTPERRPTDKLSPPLRSASVVTCNLCGSGWPTSVITSPRRHPLRVLGVWTARGVTARQ